MSDQGGHLTGTSDPHVHMCTHLTHTHMYMHMCMHVQACIHTHTQMSTVKGKTPTDKSGQSYSTSFDKIQLYYDTKF